MLDIVYRPLGLDVSKTRWVLMMMMAEGFSCLGLVLSVCESASDTVRRFGKCQCQSVRDSLSISRSLPPSLDREVNRCQLEGWMITCYSCTAAGDAVSRSPVVRSPSWWGGLNAGSRSVGHLDRCVYRCANETGEQVAIFLL